jgi:hypothetical protein
VLTPATTSPAATNAHAAPPVVFPAPGHLFFVETLPVIDAAAGTAGQEDTIQLALESHAPLPVDQLAYGWFIDTPRETIVYYATMRERLRKLTGELYEKSAFLIPDFALAPAHTAGVWLWLATPSALTAVRYNDGAQSPDELRSWALPSLSGNENPAEDGNTPDLARRATAARTLHEAQCAGKSTPGILLWQGVTKSGNTLTASWKSTTGGRLTRTLPITAAWAADVRERAWLARERKTRDTASRLNKLLMAGLATWLIISAAATMVWRHHSDVKRENARVQLQQAKVDSLISQQELNHTLDELEEGRFSFYDALATMNHIRPPDILFLRAETNSKFPRQIKVHGSGSSISAYAEALRKNETFTSVTEKSSVSAGNTVFDLNVTVGKLSVGRNTPTLREVQDMVSDLMKEILPASAETPPAGPPPANPPPAAVKPAPRPLAPPTPAGTPAP